MSEKYEVSLSEKSEKPPKPTKLKDFDDMLNLVGSWGKFQILLTVCFLPFNLLLGYVYLSSILINFTPPHWCKVPALMNLTVEERMKLAIPLNNESSYSQCSMYAPDWNQILNEGLPDEPDPSWQITNCVDGWEYDIDNYHRSVTSDFDWVCENQWVASLSQAAFFIGAIPGTMVFGYLSDKYGRIPVIVISNLLAMVTGFCTPFVTGIWTYVIIRFFTGGCFNSFFTMMYILTMEYVDESKRTFVGNIGLALILTISGVYQPWLIKGLGDWKPFSYILYCQFAIVIVAPWIMPESSRWLMSMGKTERAVKIMKNIAKMNKRELTDDAIAEFEQLCEQEKIKTKENNASLLDLFKHPVVRKNSLLIIFLFMVVSLVFDASVRNVENLNFSIYMSFMISTGLELPADLLSIVGLTHCGRRWSGSLSLALTGICMLLTLPFKSYPTAANFFALKGRFWATYGMNTAMQYTVEVMPTSLRGTGTALASIMSMLAQIASPYIVFSSVIHPDLPFILIGLIGVLSSIPVLFLPETAGVALPDTVEDAKTYGIHDNIFWMPLMGEKRRHKKSKDQDEPADVICSQNPAYNPE